jgi:hypothetical protein
MNYTAIAAANPAAGAIADTTHGPTAPNRSPAPTLPFAHRAATDEPVIETILSRSAAKYYDPTASLRDDQISDLARIGTSAPTSFHLQNWRLTRKPCTVSSAWPRTKCPSCC